MRRLVSGAASVLLAAAGGLDKPLAVGARAPEFTLLDQRGTPVRLADLLAKRQYVVVAFYVKAFTPG